jgi:hypothetical protein
VKLEPGDHPIADEAAAATRYARQGAFRERVRFLRRQFLQGGGTPFTHVLSRGLAARALAAVGGWLDRVFSPPVTLWGFLGQALGAGLQGRERVGALQGDPLGLGDGRFFSLRSRRTNALLLSLMQSLQLSHSPEGLRALGPRATSSCSFVVATRPLKLRRFSGVTL